MSLTIMLAAAALAAQPVGPQTGQHPAGHPAAPEASIPGAEEAAVKSVLSQYKSAIEKLDASGTEQLFTADSTIFETGGVEGTYANYLAHHLGPELEAFKSFNFSDYKVNVRFEGPIALATESYDYRIETQKGEVVERRGVATSVLKKIDGQWKILSMHNSARRPRPTS